MGKITNSTFHPAWWLRSKHLQTIWPSLFRKRPDFTPEWERVELGDGDFMDLAWYRRPETDAPIVMLIHGLEGSLKSHYAGNLLIKLHDNGFTGVLLHLRGRGREPNRLPQSYHSGATDDLRLIMAHLAKRRQTPAAIIGISLGGNLLLKYLGETGADNPLKTAVAASVPFSLQACATQLEQGLSKIYGHYLLNLLKQSYRTKFSLITSPLELEPELNDVQTLQQFDDAITAPLHGFEDATDYYRRCSCAQFLNTIHTPTLIIHARDDPFMRPDVIPDTADMSAAVTLELCKHGGHVGFIAGRSLFGPDYWLEQRIITHLQTVL